MFGQTGHPKITAPVEIFLNATAQQEPDASPAPETKTIIGGSRLDRVFWSERDTISVYWRASGSAEALSVGQRFHCYQYSPFRFDIRHADGCHGSGQL